MDIGANVSTARTTQAPIIFLYGKPGTGKTTLAAGAPGAFIVKTEDGTDDLAIPRYPKDVAEGGAGKVQTFAELLAVCNWLGTDPAGQQYGTVILDSLTATERLVWSATCARHNVDGIEKVLQGYGKGYNEAQQEWGQLLQWVHYFRAQGRTVILLGHAEAVRMEDPTQESFDMMQPLLHKRARALFMQEANLVLYLAQESIKITEDQGFGRSRAREVGQVKRWLYCSRGAGFEAKNRIGLPFKVEIPDTPSDPTSGWGAIQDALDHARAARS